MSAAIEAHRSGAHVVLVEQEKTCGGNSRLASSGLNGAQTQAQKLQHIDDTVGLFVEDTRKSGRGRDQAELVDLLARNSAAAIDFLEKEGGLLLTVVSLLGGHSRPRTHRQAKGDRPVNVGAAIMTAMERKVRSLAPPVDILVDTTVTELLVAEEGRRVRGVKASTAGGEAVEIVGDAVVLATGGYSSDSSGLLAEFTPHLRGLPSTNALWKTAGEGVRMGRKVGAELALMDAVQIHPTGLVDPAKPNAPVVFLAGEALRGNGGIFIDKLGKRFVNELGYRDHVSDAIFKHGANMTVAGGVTPPAVFLVLNEEAVNKFREAIQFYSFKKLVLNYPNWREFAQAHNVPIETISKTLEEYNQAAKAGSDEFGKVSFESCPFLLDQAVTVMLVTPAVHYTMGGLVIDESTRVVRKDGTPIAGLFAGGEVTGGLHGANRLGGNSLLECVVFGRIAGVSAAQI